MCKVLFWDFDGTLSYPNKSFSTALYTVLNENGYEVKKDDATGFLEKSYSWKSPEKSYFDKRGEQWWETMFDKIMIFCADKDINCDDFDKICAEFKNRLIAIDNYMLYDDTEKTLEKCVEMGYKNYLITNNYPEIIQNLEKLGIKKYFTDYVVSSHIGYEKPRTEFFDYAKNIANNPVVGYVIGDNPIADIQGGQAAGYKTIAVHECKNSDADYYVENLFDIFSILT